jgi:diguanylate cyclase (GGDEF)-like protein/PAS domain S-box-containing protein
MTAPTKITGNKSAKRPRSAAPRHDHGMGYDELLGLLAGSMKDSALFTLDREGRVAGWNAGAERLLGYRADEIVGKHVSCFYSADDVRLGKPEAALKSAAAQGRHEEQSWRIRKDGARFFASVILAPALRAGELVGYSLVARDLTELQFADTARKLFESFPDAIALLDRDGKINRTNTKFESMFGYARQELYGRPANVLFPGGLREHFDKCLAPFIAEPGRGTGASLELFGRRKDNSEFPVEIMLSPLETESISGAVAVVRDLTEAKHAAERLSKANDELIASVSELQRRDREMQSLISMDDLLQSCTTQEEAYKVVALAAAELFEGQTGHLAVVHPGNQYLEVVARWGEEALSEPIFSLEDCWALRRGQLHEVGDPGAGLLCRHISRQPEAGYLCVPLTVQGETLGVFTLIHVPAKKHPLSQLQLAVKVGEAIKLSLSNLKLREKLRAEAIHDPLTGLFNRRYLEETLARELHRARRRNSSLCVAMLDLDDFKRFNDSFGHDAGDALLNALGRVLREKLRKSDISCRYGGEEFVLVFPDSSLTDAVQRVRQIGLQIKELQISHGEQMLGGVTVSAGVARADEQMLNPGDLLRAADEALYAAKNSGRDRVIVYPAQAPESR